MPDIYTTGEFAKKANVSIRTIRFYDKQGLLKPSHISNSGYRLYTDADFARLQKILSLKYLGFSLDEIMDITVKDDARDYDYVRSSLQLQLELVRKKKESLQTVEEALLETAKLFDSWAADQQEVDWSQMLRLIHMVSMERGLVEQYKNSTNISTRIGLHQQYAVNPVSWFCWIFEQLELKAGMTVLELGCGNGSLWQENAEKIPDCRLLLSDISAGMVSDARENLSGLSNQCTFLTFDFSAIPLPDASCDMVIANHVLFYAKDIDKVLSEIRRVLKSGGQLFCSTYGKEHMKEISQLVKEFDVRIALSDVQLYDIFGLENGQDILQTVFPDVTLLTYEDELKVTDVQPLLDYILSCHGNQHEYLNDRYGEFKKFVQRKMDKKGFLHITKQAGMFRCRVSL